MKTLRKIWASLREKIDGWLEYNPNPEVVLQDGDTTVIISDSLPPEANAMALAMYSRSPRSFLEHLKEVLKKGWKKFLSQFYVGYGHQSIGDCGTTTICIEGVSMLCAKAIQQYLLYKGQEASTRYLNMLKQKVLNVLNNSEGEKIIVRWMKIYEHLLNVLVPAFKERFPMSEGEDQGKYNKAINAKAFDVARAFLPAGATTFVGWHTTLREASSHLLELRHHPLKEVREVTEMISKALHIKYPSSGFDKRYPQTEAYVESWMKQYGYMEPTISSREFSASNTFDVKNLLNFKEVLGSRPAKAELPTFLKKFGTMVSTFPLDFGSFRDLQRHRSGIILMPPLTTNHGFHEWYIEQIPPQYRSEILLEIEVQVIKIDSLECTDELRQYYIAMGFKVMCECTFDLPASVYVAELRSTQAVHPTLRVVAKQMGMELKRILPEMALHCDFSDDVWSTNRGSHDIVRK